MGLGIAVLLVAVFALREPNGHVSAARRSASSVAKNASTHAVAPTTHSARPSHSSTPPTSDTQSDSSVKSVPLIVLNNTTTSGLAAGAAQRFEAGGWTVTHYDNYQNDILSTCAYYDPVDPQAKAAAQALQAQFPTIKRVKPKFDGLPDGPLVVILTPDYSSN